MSSNHPPAPAYHDLLVKEHLPRWLSELKPAQLDRLKHLDDHANSTWLHSASTPSREALAQAQQRLKSTTFALARATADLRSVTAFAGPLLSAHLHQQFGLSANLRTLNFVRFSRDWDWKYLATLLNHRIEPLLQAALQNFEKDVEMQPESVAIAGGFQVTLHNGYDRYHYQRLPFTAAQFAALCHELDIGKRYQAHLDGVLGREPVRSLAITARREQFAVDLLVASLRTPHPDHALLQAFLEPNPQAPLPRCEQFSLFGVDVLDTLVIRPAAASQAVFLYLPGMPQALVPYASLDDCHHALLGALSEPTFRQRFLGFIQQDTVEHFANVLQHNLTGQTLASERDSQWNAPADADLHWADSAIDSELFAYLQDRHHRRLLNEARMLAVPSAEVDEAARQRRLHYWESLGLDLLGVAAFFIPAAGSLMAVVFAAQILDEIYEGVEAWEQGDIDTALEHAKALALNVAVAAATGAALHYTGKLGRKLVEVIRPDGTPRLWNGDLSPYRVEPPAEATSDALGLRQHQGRHYLELDDSHFEVQAHKDGQRWRIRHPSNPDALQPLLEHNGEGAWHGAHERPLEWPQQTLLRRLGRKVADYSDEELESASHISGISRDALLDVYLKHAPIPPRLLHTLQRVRAGRPADDPLEQVFEGFYHPGRSLPASERLALLSLEQQPGWPTDCALELRGGDRSGPLLERAGERFAGDVRLILKVPGGYRALLGDQPQTLVEDLFEAIEQSVPELKQAPRELKASIIEQAQRTPERTRGLVWSGHSGGWRDEGRLLGGGDTPPIASTYPRLGLPHDPLRGRYRRLYPNATDVQVSIELDAWQAAGKVPHLELRALERQLEYLRTSLGQWASQAPLRTVARDALIRCWQRNQLNPTELDLSAMGLDDEDLLTLPHLADAFGHVEELNLGANPLRAIPQLLMNQLPSLNTLFASALELRHVPVGLNVGLKILELTDNNIVWSSISQSALADYPLLEHLNLSGNPLTNPPRLSVTPNLREVSLFDCSLREVPADLSHLHQLEHLDLSSNHITHLPEGLEELEESTRRALNLEHNPLDEASINRIDEHYQATGIDLMVADDNYTTLLLGADDATQACWQRLGRLIPLDYRRDLRGIADEPLYSAAPATTRRRIWYMLHWLESSPRARATAQRIDASKLLHYEMLAELELPEPFANPRRRTEQYLQVAVSAARNLALDEALRVRLPHISEQQEQTLRALTLQRLGRDPQLLLRTAPTSREPVILDGAEELALQLDGPWTSALRDQLHLIDGNNEVGRDALLAEQANGQPRLPFWVRHLEQRYHFQFEQLQEQANEQLLDAENLLSEGEYLEEANHLRQQLDRERQRLLNDLTRSIADGSQTQW